MTATTPTMLGTNQTVPHPEMITLKGELTFYSGQLDQVTDEAIRLRAPFTNSTGTSDSVSIRAADLLKVMVVRRNAVQELTAEMEASLGQHDAPAPGKSTRLRAE